MLDWWDAADPLAPPGVPAPTPSTESERGRRRQPKGKNCRIYVQGVGFGILGFSFGAECLETCGAAPSTSSPPLSCTCTEESIQFVKQAIQFAGKVIKFVEIPLNS